MSKTNLPLKLVGEGGNAFSILGRAKDSLRKGKRMDLWEEFSKEAMSGDYDHLLCTCMDWFDTTDEDVCYDREEDAIDEIEKE